MILHTLSGKELVLSDSELEDVLQRGQTLKAMKQHLSSLVGATRFQQQILQDGKALCDSTAIADLKGDLQLVILPLQLKQLGRPLGHYTYNIYIYIYMYMCILFLP